MTPRTTNLRHTRRYKTLHSRFRATCTANNEHCWLCGQPIEYTLPAEHPESFSLDHRIPVTDAPQLAYDPANFAPAHLDCNKHRGQRAPHLQVGQPSEDW